MRQPSLDDSSMVFVPLYNVYQMHEGNTQRRDTIPQSITTIAKFLLDARCNCGRIGASTAQRPHQKYFTPERWPPLGYEYVSCCGDFEARERMLVASGALVLKDA
jgi:hypothetical protein